MPLVHFIGPRGAEIAAIETPVGRTVMESARLHGIPGIPGECGGSCACASCHVHVDPAWVDLLPSPRASETIMLAEIVDHRPNSRLSCQIGMTDALDGLVVKLPG